MASVDDGGLFLPRSNNDDSDYVDDDDEDDNDDLDIIEVRSARSSAGANFARRSPRAARLASLMARRDAQRGAASTTGSAANPRSRPSLVRGNVEPFRALASNFFNPPPPPSPEELHRPPRPRQPAGASASASATVIDLTEEPESPDRPQLRASASLSQSQQSQGAASSRNFRRMNSQRLNTPPRLERSDGSSFSGNPPRLPPPHNADLIDLTADSPEDDDVQIPPQPPRLRNHPHPRGAISGRRPREAAPALPEDELFQYEIVEERRRFPGFLGGNFAGLGGLAERILAGGDFIRAGFHQPVLNVDRNPFARREPSPKPAVEPAPPARAGFTRDTRGDSSDDDGDDARKGSPMVVICPACSEELAYDPADTSAQSTVPSGSRKRKRAPGEHHFWAVKKCGHVYCADCFENRRLKGPNGAGFRKVPGGKDDFRCVVDSCDTKVTNKSEWVGIFL